MNNEKIYVVVPVYNVEPYLERCIDSILNQTYQDFELILVDDGSPDNCPAICDRYAAEHKNITVIHQENGGLSAARNAGIDYAFKNGNPEQDWINFIDSDDFVHPKYLEYLYRAAKETGVEISSCGFTRTASQNIASADIGAFEFENLTPEEYWHKRRINATVAWGKLYRLILFKSIKYPVGKIHEDTFTTWKLMFQCSEITSTEDRLYCYYINPESITASTWTPHRMAVLDALKEQIDFFDRNGYLKARKPIIEFLFWTSIKQLMLIKGLSPKYDSHIPEIKKWRKYAFTLYSQEFGLIRTVAYLFNIRIIDPAKHILRNESVFSFMKRKIKKKLHIK